MVLRSSDPAGPDFGPPPDQAPEPAVAGPRAPLPPCCTALIAACTAVFLGQMLGLGLPGVRAWALYGPAVAAGQWWRVLTAVLVHGGVMHIVFNMMTVVSLGFPVERMLGTARMIPVSLVSALGSAALVLAFNFDQGTVGASGMILGWAGVLFPVINRESRRQLASQLVLVVVISFLPGVSGWGHLGGFLAGLGCGGLLRLGPRRFNVLWPLVCLALVLVITGLANARGLAFQ